MKLNPIRDVITVKRDQATSLSSNGIYLSSNKASSRGIVLAKGCDVNYIEVNDHIVFNPFSGTEASCNGETILLIRSSEVLGFCET